MRNYATEEQKEEWGKRYLLGETAREIAKDYPQFHESTISRNIKKMGISRGNLSTTIYDNSEQIIQDYLNGMYCEDIAKKYNVEVHSIYHVLDKAKIERRTGKHSNCNEDYFEKINTPNKAYLLGFITADGSIVGQYHSTCQIEIKNNDIDLLYFARKEISPNQKIYNVEYNNKSNSKINFSSKKLCNDLKKYGIVPNKSKIIKDVPVDFVPKELLRYYFRGLIDGDGCVHKDGKISIYSGSESFIKSVQKILVEEAGVKALGIYFGTTYFITWSSKSDREKLYNYLYKDILDETFYYKRKYERLYNSLYGNI